jgi:anti-anti-sigma factor
VEVGQVAGATSIEVVDAADQVVVYVHGDLDIATAPQLRQVVTDLARTRPRRVVLDLGRCRFLDSAGVGAIVLGVQLLGAGVPARFLLKNLHRMPRRVLDIVGLLGVVPVIEPDGPPVG